MGVSGSIWKKCLCIRYSTKVKTKVPMNRTANPSHKGIVVASPKYKETEEMAKNSIIGTKICVLEIRSRTGLEKI
jgi:hypothetical protein